MIQTIQIVGLIALRKSYHQAPAPTESKKRWTERSGDVLLAGYDSPLNL